MDPVAALHLADIALTAAQDAALLSRVAAERAVKAEDTIKAAMLARDWSAFDTAVLKELDSASIARGAAMEAHNAAVDKATAVVNFAAVSRLGPIVNDAATASDVDGNMSSSDVVDGLRSGSIDNGAWTDDNGGSDNGTMTTTAAPPTSAPSLTTTATAQ
jgi:hypothetical protein